MHKSILVDLNIILDVFLEREGYMASSNTIQIGELSAYNVCISAHIVSTFAYLLENAKVTNSQILKHIEWLLSIFTVVPVDSNLISKALKSKITDFEDALIEQAACIAGCSIIITRNIKDFKLSSIKALTPEDYLSSITQ